MPLDVLAATVVSQFLLPALKDGAENILTAVSDKVSEQAAAHAGSLVGNLWAKVDNVLGGSQKEKTTLENFKEDPEVYEGAVTKLLQRKIDENPALGDEIQALLDEKVPGTSMTGAQVWNAGVVGIADARQANFAGARDVDIVGVQMGDSAATSRVPPPPPPAPPPTTR